MSGNPYDPPALSEYPGEEYYAEDLTRIPFIGLYRLMSPVTSPLVAVPLAALFRLRAGLNMPLQVQYGIGPAGSDQTVNCEALPEIARATILGLVSELEEIGFSVLKYGRGNVIGAKRQYSVIMLDTDQYAIVHIEWMQIPGAQGPATELSIEWNSLTGEDPEIMTCRVNPSHVGIAPFIMPDFVDWQCYGHDVSLEDVYDLHLDRAEVRNPIRFTPESALSFHLECSRRRFQAVVRKGLLRRLSPGEVARIRNQKLS